MTSPLPPSGSSVAVRPVMFGEAWTDPNGVEQIAAADTVLLELCIDGKPVASRTQTPESAIALARLLSTAAGECFKRQVGDDGKQLSAMERLALFNKAWGGTS